MTTIIEGKKIQEKILAELMRDVMKLKNEKGVTPGLALIMINGEDPLAKVNYRLHTSLAKALHFNVFESILPAGTSEEEVVSVINQYNEDDQVHGILVLLPLPENIRIQNLINAIHPDKELEGFHPENASRLFPTSNQSIKYPMCVPTAVHKVLGSLEEPYKQANYVVAIDKELEETNVIANMVARIGTVTMAPKEAKSIKIINMEAEDIIDHCKEADVLVISTQKPQIVTKEWVKPGACVIDFNPIPAGFKPHPSIEGQFIPILKGGVNVESVQEAAKYIAPVPGGVGPVMLGVLMNNVYLAALKALSSKQLVQS
jgi:methylenetetrahydrofolate dehydrogenase (NADP+) / methenyltetrahydrofolate cyclohydrolase